MSKYTFLQEMNQNGRPPDNNPLLGDTYSTATMASVFKPFQFGNLMTLRREALIAASTKKLNAISNLEKNLRAKMQDPAHEKTRNKLAIDAKYVMTAYKMHHQYTSKLIFWKSRSMLMMGPQVKQLQEQYTRQLFMLNQDYQRTTLNLKTAPTQNY